MIKMFSVMYGNSVFLVLWKWVIGVIWVGSLCQCCGLAWFWNRNDCGKFSKMRYCASVDSFII